ncbi:hypothetical protein PVAP13_3NG314300 [Panicum virgatum]|uniref:DUF1618 domain-containing protein n=1 Tax=Panicum virgatum TaxID=38727 RepID=A0A8T0UAH4_PANVG|nr:hypothetical protein PVAP13_3NG314300 [Panicum virgatum]
MPAAAQEPWSILAAIPDVVGYTKEKRIMPPGTDISVARNELPRVSVLTVSPHISLLACLGLYPYVAAADRSGLLLLCGTHPVTSTSATISYHICDARTGEAASLPNPPRRMACYGTSIGLIVKGDGCMVAGLQSVSGGGGAATLLSYKVGNCCTWREREITCSPPLPRDWYPEGAISHGGMLWWVDLSFGLLACDPFVEEPELLHVPLPQVLDELPADDQINCGARRCVKVSGGRLRYVQIHGDAGTPVVSTWALTDAGEWNPERRMPMAEVWIDESYVNTMLPLSIPAHALLHPTNPDRVYFFLRSCIFAVDLRLRKLMEFNECEMRAPPRELLLKRSSRFVHAWQYDPSSNRSDTLTLYRHA